MKAKLLALLLGGGCALLILAAPALIPEQTVPIPRDFTNQAFPRFSNGFVVAYDFSRAIIWSFDRTGKTLMEVPLTLTDANRVQIADITAAPDGTIAVSGSAANYGGYTSAALIFWISPSGKISRVVRTSPFGANRIAFSVDGTLWAGGRVHDAEKKNDLPEYDVLRLYDTQGRLMRTALPRTTFRSGVDTRIAGAESSPARHSFLLAAKDRVGFYSANATEYIELSLSGEVLGRWKFAPPPENVDIMGAALTSSGRVFVSGMRAHKSGDPPTEWRLLFYELDKASGAVKEIDFPQDGVHRATLLLGSEGDKLVFYSKPPASISWFAAP